MAIFTYATIIIGFEYCPQLSFSSNGCVKMINIVDYNAFSSVSQQRIALIRDIFRALLKKIHPNYSDLLSLCSFAVKFELALSNKVEARTLCHELLRQQPHVKEFWKVYADVEGVGL